MKKALQSEALFILSEIRSASGQREIGHFGIDAFAVNFLTFKQIQVADALAFEFDVARTLLDI